jgi:hypothetical protein
MVDCGGQKYFLSKIFRKFSGKQRETLRETEIWSWETRETRETILKEDNYYSPFKIVSRVSRVSHDQISVSRSVSRCFPENFRKFLLKNYF